jgi:hypothetical protein
MSDLSRASHWRQRADELRAIIARLHARDEREPLLALAGDLDRMAERLERREKSKGYSYGPALRESGRRSISSALASSSAASSSILARYTAANSGASFRNCRAFSRRYSASARR